jgi:hypothetical protein
LGRVRAIARRAFFVAVCHTNRRNKGLISVDRRTSLLSYVQYPVPYQSRLQRIYRFLPSQVLAEGLDGRSTRDFLLSTQ